MGARENRLAEVKRLGVIKTPQQMSREELQSAIDLIIEGESPIGMTLEYASTIARELRLADARVRELEAAYLEMCTRYAALEATLCQLRDDYRTPEPCGHMKNFLIGDEHGHFTCTVCRADKLEAALRDAPHAGDCPMEAFWCGGECQCWKKGLDA